MSILTKLFGSTQPELKKVEQPVEKFTYKQLVAKLKAENIALTTRYKAGEWGLYEEVRYKHIAYCLYRGRTMEQIEPKNHVHVVAGITIQHGTTAYCHKKAKTLLESYQKQTV